MRVSSWAGWAAQFRLLVLGIATLVAGSAFAQSSPSDIFVNEEAAGEQVIYQSLRGFTGYGVKGGLMRFYGADVAENAQVRPILQGDFRYRFSDAWIGKGEFGFGWNSFDARQDTVLAVTFGTLGIERQFQEWMGLTMRTGGGLGMYRWNYKDKGKSVRDPITQQFYRGFVPGLYLGVEGEKRISQHATFSLGLQNHYIMTSDDKFEVLFDQNVSALSLRAGLHYHFSPYEGIFWERQEKKVIRLTSGKSDK